MGLAESTLKTVKRLIDELAAQLHDKLKKLQHMSLSEVAGYVFDKVCEVWDDLIPDERAPIIKKEACEVIVLDEKRYISYLANELMLLADRLVDFAMEALAKHVDTLPGSIYARLSWVIVNYSGVLANNLTTLVKVLEKQPNLAPLVEFVAVVMALRALALYRLIQKLDTAQIAELIDHIESFVTTAVIEERNITQKLASGIRVEFVDTS